MHHKFAIKAYKFYSDYGHNLQILHFFLSDLNEQRDLWIFRMCNNYIVFLLQKVSNTSC